MVKIALKFEIGVDLLPSVKKFILLRDMSISDYIDVINFGMRHSTTYLEINESVRQKILRDYNLDDVISPLLHAAIFVAESELAKYLIDRGLKYLKQRL